jgi:gamma-glutamylcyclotransferase
MSSENIIKRLSDVEFHRTGKIDDMILLCNKRSTDGSGKANIIPSKGDEVWGVLYYLNKSQLEILDKIESGYHREEQEILLNSGTSTRAEVYASLNIREDPVATEYYKNNIVKGAMEHDLPDFYVNHLKQIKTL